MAIDSDLVPSVAVAVAILLKPLFNVLEVGLKVGDFLAIASSIAVQDSSLSLEKWKYERVTSIRRL